MANPFAYEEYRKEKIRQKIDESRTQRVNVQVGGLVFHTVTFSKRYSLDLLDAYMNANLP